MSGMEPEVRNFLTRVSLSILAGLIWLFTNITAGIFMGWLFFDTHPTTGNYIFYTWLLLSFVGLIAICLRLWKNRFR
jgi:hypothetical protein